MNKSNTDKINTFTFFKNAIFSPKTNIHNQMFVSIKSNIALLLLLLLVTPVILTMINLPIMGAMSPYAALGLYVIYAGLFMYILWIPVFFLNISGIYFLNKKHSSTARSYQKVLSDHTTILIRFFLLYSIGFTLFSYLETTYITLVGHVMIFVSIMIYICLCISLVKYYMTDSQSKSSMILFKYMAMGIGMMILAIIPLLILAGPEVYELLVEAFFINIRLALEDIGIMERPGYYR